MKVLINGAAGKMGRELVKAISCETDMVVCGACDVSNVGQDVGEVSGVSGLAIPIVDEIELVLSSTSPDVVVDFTNPAALRANVERMLAQKIRLVVGTSGVDAAMVAYLAELCKQTGSKIIIAPNFAIGAVLMMKFAKIAAQYMSVAEIIELHHDRKIDAPSGTAIRTAELIAQGRDVPSGNSPAEDMSTPENAFRGGRVQGIPVHSVRLPGLMAHQETIFGALGQTLTIRHDSVSRESFMPGVLLAIRQVGSIDGVVYGLENLL